MIKKKLIIPCLFGVVAAGIGVIQTTHAVTYYPYTSNSYNGYHNPMDLNTHQAQVPTTTGWEPTPQYDRYYNKDIGGAGTVNGKYVDNTTATVNVDKAQSTYYHTTKQQEQPKTYNTVNGQQNYLNNDQISSGWDSDNGGMFFRDANSKRLTDWKNVDGNWYYFSSDGYVRKGWQKVGSSWYNLGTDGKMKTGWVKAGSSWYYLQSNGAMKTGWAQLNGKWYLLASNGAMKTGWTKDNGKWYYLQSDGSMKTGWLKDGSSWYFLNSNGSMQTSSFKLGGVTYKVNSSGVCTW